MFWYYITFYENISVQGNGYISRPTLKGLLKEIASDLTDAQLEAAVDEIDEDGSGKIEFEGRHTNFIPLQPFKVNVLFQSSGS